MPDSYADLSIDDLAEMTSADAANLPQINEQMITASQLEARLFDSVGLIRNARDRISSTGSNYDSASNAVAQLGQSVAALFRGSSAEATFQRVSELLTSGGKAHAAVSPQSSVFQRLYDGVQSIHRRMSELQLQRNHWLSVAAADPHNPELLAEFGKGLPPASTVNAIQTAVRQSFDKQGRAAMSEATSEYFQTVKTLRPITPYDGPRIPSLSSTTGNSDRFSQSGPPLSRDVAGTGSESSYAASASTSDGLNLQSGAPSSAVTVPVATEAAPRTPIGQTPNVIGPGGSYLPSRTVTSSVVFGQRGDDARNSRFRSPSRFTVPNARNGTQSVIGRRFHGASGNMRPGASGQPRSNIASPYAGRPNGNTSMLNRGSSGIGGPSRSSPMIPHRPMSQAARSNVGTAGLSRSNTKKAPQPHIRAVAANKPGARAVAPLPSKADGRVIRVRMRTVLEIKRIPFSRTQRMVHGGNENTNRRVIRNSRAPQPIHTKKTPTKKIDDIEGPESDFETTIDWFDNAPTVRPVIQSTRSHR